MKLAFIMGHSLSFSFFLLLASCGNYIELKEDDSSSTSEDFLQSELTFENITNKIIEPNCIYCHRQFQHYEIVVEIKEKILETVVSGQMPQDGAPLDDDLQILLKEWVAAGAPLE